MANLRCTSCGRYVNGPGDHDAECPLYMSSDAYSTSTPPGRTLDYVPRLVEANNNYRIRSLTAAPPIRPLWDTPQYWAGGAVLDQGSEGSCVGHGVVGEFLASPARGQLPRKNLPGPYYSQVGHEVAVDVYNRAKEIDEWEGINYDGTSVRAGMLVGRERGWWDSFYWAKNMDEMRQGLTLGTVVVGVTWKRDMYETRLNGDVVISGPEVGAHCLYITGYSPNFLNRGKRFRWQNSWGPDYGIQGRGYISPEDLDHILFQSGNECAVAIGRRNATA